MLKILGKSPSINVRKVLWTCAELGLPYECPQVWAAPSPPPAGVKETWGGPAFPCEQEQWGAGFQATDDPAFKALNPNAQVPVIVDGEVVLWESNTICRYLARRQGRSDLLPTDAFARAKVEQWMDWQLGDLNNAWRYAFMALVRRSPAHTDATAIEASVAQWNAMMGVLERQLARTGAHVLGDTFTLADVVLGLAVHRWYATPLARPELPAVAAYYQRLSERAAFRLHGRNGQP